jgi:hypothetical protein
VRYWVTCIIVVGLVALTALGASLAAMQETSTKTTVTLSTTTTMPSATTTTTTTSMIVPVATCRLTDLDGVVVKETSAAGTQYVQVALHNYRGTLCSLEGTPTVTLLGAGGMPLPSREGSFSTTDFDGQANLDRLVLLNSGATATITVRASGWASFTLAHISGGPITEPQTACPTTSAIAVGLQSASGTVVIPVVLHVFGSYHGAPCGSFIVGSFYAGLGPQP